MEILTYHNTIQRAVTGRCVRPHQLVSARKGPTTCTFPFQKRKKNRSNCYFSFAFPIEPSGEVIHLVEHTTSSSSDSIFTDPCTPVGPFATEINEAYYSEEDLIGAQNGETESTPVRSLEAIIAKKLQQLSVHKVDSIDLNANSVKDTEERWREKLTVANVSNISVKSGVDQQQQQQQWWLGKCAVENVNNISLDGRQFQCEVETSEVESQTEGEEMELNFRNNTVNPCGTVQIQTDRLGTPTDECKDKSIFNVARVKKVELSEIKTPNSLYATPCKYAICLGCPKKWKHNVWNE